MHEFENVNSFNPPVKKQIDPFDLEVSIWSGSNACQGNPDYEGGSPESTPKSKHSKPTQPTFEE